MTTRDSHDIKEYEAEQRNKEIFDRLMDVVRWHAQLQVSFDRQLQRELASDTQTA